jgi:hypothetical protein
VTITVETPLETYKANHARFVNRKPAWLREDNHAGKCSMEYMQGKNENKTPA